MPLKLTPELKKALPEPDSSGVIRASASLKVNGETVDVLEINDTPVTYSDDEDAADKGADQTTNDDANPMPPGEVPDLTGMHM